MFNDQHIQAFRQRETPFYYYDLDRLEQVLQALKRETDPYGYHVHYAVKANAHTRILKTMRSYGLGADCVSGGELQRCREVGFSGQQVAFAGVGKTDAEIRLGLEYDIFSFNVESMQELEVIDQLAARSGTRARIALRLNPDVNPNTHKYITTGLEENKFGINPWELDQVVEKLKGLKHVDLTGLHFHIGSQIQELDAFKQLCLRANELHRWFADRTLPLTHINVGGGLGVDYTQPDAQRIPEFGAYFDIFHRFLEVRPGQEVHFELGRALVAHVGDLISRVLYVKPGVKTQFAILDAGMTELIRPALYQAYHKIEHLSPSTETVEKYDVVGPICESSDCFGKQVELPVTKRGDLLAIRSVGAYGEVMASQYNLRPTAPVVFQDELEKEHDDA